MNIAICDDNKQTVETIYKYVSRYLEKTEYEYQLHTYSSGEELLAADEKPDIVFLDVEMNGISGLTTAKELQQINENVIIMLVTAFDYYIDDALDLELYRFITKPINNERIIDCLKSAIKKHLYQNDEKISLSYNNTTVFLFLSNIIYIGIENKNVYVYTYDKEIKTNKSFEWWRRKTCGKAFVQSHQSYLVNMRYVEAFDKNSTTLRCRDKLFTVHISKRKYGEFKKAFKIYLRGTGSEW